MFVAEDPELRNLFRNVVEILVRVAFLCTEEYEEALTDLGDHGSADFDLCFGYPLEQRSHAPLIA